VHDAGWIQLYRADNRSNLWRLGRGGRPLNGARSDPVYRLRDGNERSARPALYA